MIKLKPLLTILAISAIGFSKGQVILSQDFEGPLTGWSNQGILTTSQNSITPHGGSGMVSLSTGNALTSPTFALPSGAKFISFWFNSFNDSPFNYSISADLLLNGSPVLALGTWQSDIYSNINPWSLKGINIPTGFSGSNYSVSFKVPTSINPVARFYLDDILVSGGTFDVGIKQNTIDPFNLIITSDLTNERVIKLIANSEISNADLEVISIEGKKVFTKNDISISSKNVIEIDLTQTYGNFYFISLTTNKGKVVKKVIF